MRGASEIDRRGIAGDLRAAIEGEVRFDTGSRALYATDASNYRLPPIGVVVPRHVDELVEIHRVCREHGAPIVLRGGGTSLAGQGCNTAVLIDCSKYLHRILEVDPDRRIARVEPGCILDHLRGTASEKYGLTFGPDPSTHAYCTLGGMLGNNSCGRHSVQSEFHGPGPRVADNLVELEVLTYRGERLRIGRGGAGVPDAIADRLHALVDANADEIRARYPQIPRRVSGYNLDELLPENGFEVARSLVGTESTCVTILEATLELIPKPPCVSLLAVGYPDKFRTADHVMLAREHRPISIEGMDGTLIEDLTRLGIHRHERSLLPDGKGWLLVEFGGETKEEADEKARALMRDLERDGRPPSGIKLYDDPASEQHIWEVREAGLGATAFVPGRADRHEGWEDSAVPPERLGEYLRRLSKLADEYGYESSLYGHYGQGCVHARWNFDLVTKPGIAKFRRWLEDASDLVIELGGSLSGEHGDGQARAELLPKMFGPDLVRAFEEFKSIWDPDWKMNPGKVVRPYRVDENLRLGVDYEPWRPKVKFGYPKDHGDFAHATVRCVGVGKCRTPGGASVMCPSFMVTREEMHSTRGRSRLLFEMLEGDVITDGWQSDEVMEALDLCLACKGCTNDCPVNVDMPTYKAEFLHHRWKHRLRPRHAYAFGLVDQVARLASRAPGVVNFVTRTPPFAQACKLAAGMTQERAVPKFAPLTLQQWFAQRGGTTNPTGRKVVLFPDTFNNHLHTDVGVARGRGARGGRLAGRDARRPRLLRAAALRLRLPRPGGALPAAQPRPVARVVPRRDSGRRARAELRGRLQGRAREAPAARPRREAARAEHLPLRRVLREVRRRAASSRAPSLRLGPLPPQGDRRHRLRGRAAEEDGRRGRHAERRLLRAGGLVGLRDRPPRHLDAVRRAGAPAQGARAGRRDAGRCRRLLLQDADRAGEHGEAGAPRRAGAEARA